MSFIIAELFSLTLAADAESAEAAIVVVCVVEDDDVFGAVSVVAA